MHGSDKALETTGLMQFWNTCHSLDGTVVLILSIFSFCFRTSGVFPVLLWLFNCSERPGFDAGTEWEQESIYFVHIAGVWALHPSIGLGL